MSELTLKDIEHLLDIKLDETLDAKLQPIKTGMAHLATQESLDELAKTVAKIEQTVSSHTTSLDKLLTAKKNKADKEIVSVDRFDRLENWAQLVGQKLGIELKL
jgi:hypothetical protein